MCLWPYSSAPRPPAADTSPLVSVCSFVEADFPIYPPRYWGGPVALYFSLQRVTYSSDSAVPAQCPVLQDVLEKEQTELSLYLPLGEITGQPRLCL